MTKEIENQMVNDACWPDEDEPEREDPWEKFCREADEAYDDRWVGIWILWTLGGI